MKFIHALTAKILLINSIAYNNVSAWEYCSIKDKLCPAETEHLMCNPKVKYEEKISFFSKQLHSYVPNTKIFKDFILDKHNEWRDKVASGEVTAANGQFPKAAHMRELVWDYELEFLAKQHMPNPPIKVKDNCRSTKRFPLTGQTVSCEYLHILKDPFLVYFNSTMKHLFNEKDDVKDPANYPSNFTNKEKGRFFSQIVNDRVSRVGCSGVVGMHCTKKDDPNETIKSFCMYVTCNYDYSWAWFKRTYEPHPTTAGADCGTEWGGAAMSTKWPNLCANDGSLFPEKTSA